MEITCSLDSLDMIEYGVKNERTIDLFLVVIENIRTAARDINKNQKWSISNKGIFQRFSNI